MKVHTSKLKILLFCIISIGIINAFEFTGLYSVPLIYAITTTLPLHPATIASSATIKALKNNIGNITSLSGNRTLPCIGGLPCGTWKITSNGLTGYLFITSIDSQGRLNGSIFGQKITGSWNQVAKKITFSQTIINGSRSVSSYVYNGFYHELCNRLVGSWNSTVTSIFNPLTGVIQTIKPTGSPAGCIVISGSAIPNLLPSPASRMPREFGWIALYLPELSGR